MKENALIEAKEWDRTNPAMSPVDVPYGCKAVYRYQQPVVHDRFENLPNDSLFMGFDGWGIVTVQSDYIMTPQEKEARQVAMSKEGASVVGNMRLTSQTFSRDRDETSIDKLGDMLEPVE